MRFCAGERGRGEQAEGRISRKTGTKKIGGRKAGRQAAGSQATGGQTDRQATSVYFEVLCRREGEGEQAEGRTSRKTGTRKIGGRKAGRQVAGVGDRRTDRQATDRQATSVYFEVLFRREGGGEQAVGALFGKYLACRRVRSACGAGSATGRQKQATDRQATSVLATSDLRVKLGFDSLCEDRGTFGRLQASGRQAARLLQSFMHGRKTGRQAAGSQVTGGQTDRRQIDRRQVCWRQATWK